MTTNAVCEIICSAGQVPFEHDAAQINAQRMLARDGSNLVPTIPVGCAYKRKVGALVQCGIIDMAKEPAPLS